MPRFLGQKFGVVPWISIYPIAVNEVPLLVVADVSAQEALDVLVEMVTCHAVALATTAGRLGQTGQDTL